MTLFKNLPVPETSEEPYFSPTYFKLERDPENGRRVHLLLSWPDADCPGPIIWTHLFETLAEKRGVLKSLAPTGLTLSAWGRMTMTLGSPPLNAIFCKAVDDWREESRRKAADAHEDAMARRRVSLYSLEKKKRYWLELTRESADEPEWSISFMGKSERDRLLDWMRWQKPRFLAFLEHAAEHGDEALNELLLAEMFAAERRVKKEGRGAGGNRPLRMWRGV